jgi:uncharacterized HAD superfamily protein
MRQQFINSACDCDGTLVPDSIWEFHQYLGRLFGKTVSQKDLNQYIKWETYFEISSEQVFEAEYNFYHTERYKALVMDPDAIKVLRFIQQHERFGFHDVVTARSPEHQHGTYYTINAEQGLFRRAFHTDKRCKVESYDFSLVSFFFEDSIKDACKAALHFPSLQVYLLKLQWNRESLEDLIAPDNVLVVDNWKEIGVDVEKKLALL